MSTIITTLGSVITWIMGLFTDLFNFITTSGHELLLVPIGLAILAVAVAILFRVARGLGLRSKRR